MLRIAIATSDSEAPPCDESLSSDELDLSALLPADLQSDTDSNTSNDDCLEQFDHEVSIYNYVKMLHNTAI